MKHFPVRMRLNLKLNLIWQNTKCKSNYTGQYKTLIGIDSAIDIN